MRLILLVAVSLAAAPQIVAAQTSSGLEWTMFLGSRVRLTSQGVSRELRPAGWLPVIVTA